MTSLASYSFGQRLYTGRRYDVLRGTAPDGRPVVLKILQQLHPKPEEIARFRHEYETLSSVRSEHVVAAHALVTDRRRWALVQEDFGGVALLDQLDDPALGLGDRLDIAIDVATGLCDVHRQHVVHKDINPSNIVRNPGTGQVKLIDFGIATALSSERPAFSNRRRLQGTLRYISPEQTGRVRASVDFRSDLYSFGVTLYQLFGGQLPFATDDPMELVHAHIARKPRSLLEVAPTLPSVLNHIVMRLLSKRVEDRYHSTAGLLADLLRCRAGLLDGHIEPFEIGAEDVSERLLIPPRLYGRGDAAAQLVAALEATASGRQSALSRTAGVLVTGAAGMGKSALVQELFGPLTARRGYYVLGKFEQFRRAPFSALVAAFSGLVTELLGQSADRLDRLRNDLVAALGPNGGLIIDVIPQVELIIGPQPPVQELGAAETLNRLDGVFRDFVRVFARPDHPVVLFLDDLQWADAASLKLMHGLMSDERQALLVLGAYRDDEVDGTHPLTATLRDLRTDGIRLVELALTPLSTEDVARLLTDCTHGLASETEALAGLIVRNTGGNPLFVREYVKTLAADGLIRLDRQLGRWVWQLADIQARGSTESVLGLMAGRLQRHDARTLQVLQVAACAGATFELPTVAAIQQQTVEQVWRTLVPAVEQGLVVATSELDALISDESSPEQRCSFFHDRIQQAAYESMAETDRVRTHLAIGRLLHEQPDTGERQQALFDIVFQLNRGRTLIDEPGERLALARLNLEAGRRAAASAAHDAAAQYCELGIELLAPDAWVAEYELAMELHRTAAEATHAAALHDRSQTLIEACLQHAQTDVERADLHVVLVRQHTLLGRYPEAIDAARRGLALLDFNLVDDDYMNAMLASFGELQKALAGVEPSSLLDRPLMTDEIAQARCRLLSWSMAPAFYINPLLYSVVGFEAMRLIAIHGTPRDAQAVYAQYGHLLGALFGDPPGGYAYTVLSRDICDRYGNLVDKTEACFLSGNFAHCWVEPMRTARPILEEGLRAGLQSGGLQFARYNLIYLGLNDFIVGEPLHDVLVQTEEQLAYCRRHQDQIATDACLAGRLVIRDLAGLTAHAGEFAGDGLDDEAFSARLEANAAAMIVCYYNVFKCGALTIYRDWTAALAASAAATATVAAIPGNICVGRLAFYTGLCLAGDLTERGEEFDGGHAEQMAAIVAQLEGYAGHCEANWGHTLALVRAEVARVQGDGAAAIQGYETAIHLAETHQWPADHALACELAGRYWAAQGRDELAGGYLAQARYGYERWGAGHKLAALDDEFPTIARRNLPRAGTTTTGQRSVSITSTEQSTGLLDLASVIKAAQAISGEIRLDRLLERLMAGVLENAGASHGVLVVSERGELAVRAAASMTIDEDGGESLQTHVDLNLSLGGYEHVPAAVVYYAARTSAVVALDDAVQDGRFARDPYIASQRPGSILCIPLRTRVNWSVCSTWRIGP